MMTRSKGAVAGAVLSPLGTPAVVVIDMNGSVVKQWDGYNHSAGGPARVLPGGIGAPAGTEGGALSHPR